MSVLKKFILEHFDFGVSGLGMLNVDVSSPPPRFWFNLIPMGVFFERMYCGLYWQTPLSLQWLQTSLDHEVNTQAKALCVPSPCLSHRSGCWWVWLLVFFPSITGKPPVLKSRFLSSRHRLPVGATLHSQKCCLVLFVGKQSTHQCLMRVEQDLLWKHLVKSSTCFPFSHLTPISWLKLGLCKFCECPTHVSFG